MFNNLDEAVVIINSSNSTVEYSNKKVDELIKESNSDVQIDHSE